MFLDSFNRFFFRFFPIPKFLSTTSFGLDISDESLKYVELIATNKGIKLGKYGERKIPIGIIEAGTIKDPKGLENVLTALRKEDGVRFVRVSLPEEQVYMFRLSLDKAGLVNVREAIELSLEEHIPIPAQEAIFDYETLKEDAQKIELQVGAIPQNIIENYLLVFRNSLISVQSFELEAQSISRSVIKKGDKGTYMIVDFGRTRAGIFIISEGVAVFTSTLNLGGEMLTSMIKKNFNVTTEEADQMKKKFGLQRNSENREIFSVLLNSVSVLRDEMMKNLLYWQTHKDEEGNDHPPVQKIILTGGDANLIGLAEYISISTKNTVEVGNVWTNITDTENSTPEITFNKSLTFAAALGLALGDFEHD